MPLDRFLSLPDSARRRLVVANRTKPEPFQQMVENLFAEQSVGVGEIENERYEENTVLLLEGSEVIATSPLKELQDAVLMVNSDLYITDAESLGKTNVPDVINRLTDARFSLRGYPKSNSEKLLLILMSRHIERLAYKNGSGRLRSSFQRLSRIKDERGTRAAYEKVTATDVDVHVYGKPDWRPTRELDVTMHAGEKWDFENSWFVVYSPPDGAEQDSAGLLAIETDDATWEGFWTYNPEIVNELAKYIRVNL